MLLKTFRGVIPGMCTNTYIVHDEVTKEGIMIDIVNNVDQIASYIEENNINLKYIVLTHCHADHTVGLQDFKNQYPTAKILIHEDDYDGLTNSKINQCEIVGVEPNFVSADITLKDNDEITFGNLKAQIIHTPGHTKGSISILVEDALFSGDTLFKGTHGRTDLPTGSENDMESSLKRLLELPDNTIVYPGHGFATMIMDER